MNKLSRDDWRSTLGVTAIRACRMRKGQLQAANTIPPSHSGRQASSRRPCCHKESAVASGQPNLSGRELTEQHRRLCVSETSLSAPPIEAQGNQPACRQSCDRACGACCLGSKSIQADIAAELALASSGMTRPFPCAIFLAYSNWAGLTGLGSCFPAVSPSAFLY